METVYYTLTARGAQAGGALEQAAGGRRSAVPAQKQAACRPARDKVVDLAAWRAAREAEDRADGAPEPAWAEDRSAGDRCARRETGRLVRWLGLLGEAAATLSVVAVAAALLLRIAAF